MRYISRSQIETWRRCPRKGWITYGYGGRGLRTTNNYVPLVDGSAVHSGVAEILRTGDTEKGVTAALDYYNRTVQNKNFVDVAVEYMEYTKAEQSALVEAMVRVWAYKEYPQIMAKYDVKLIEREVDNELFAGLDFLATADAVLREKTSRDVFVYSLKTMASYDVRAEKTYQCDLQGVTESVMVERKIKHRVAGVRYCFLIKGPRYRQKDQNEEPTGLWIQDTPLLVGWKRYTTNGVAYAHRYKIPNEYGAGYSTLGKGWIKFNVWEEPGLTIKHWVEMLWKEQIQPTSINVVKNSCHVPVERFKYPTEVARVLVQITADAKRIKYATETLQTVPGDRAKIDRLAPPYQHSCFYPGKCEFAESVCHKGTGQTIPESITDAIREGKLEWRVSHHPIEQKWIESGEKR